MLELRNIVKTYVTGDETVNALNGISVAFRKSEFVSVLGPSGCGKTTLLNIIGGLDHYTDGDLVINGRSTKEYTDADFDVYRNHSVGFVFQSYNLIPHQTVLSNVELALTLSGVSGSERRRRAVEALEKVGLGGQIKKKPNQMSGGQMQRVAIARALVNDPDILLADEPTGALDSETSVQIMDILREVAKDRLVIMVTHNPELAETYSTRIIRVLDGKVQSDSDPYDPEPTEAVSDKKQIKKARKEKKSMSFFTALSLSLNNLMTKKTRTFLTAFAGSIGIIGIALILSVSTGVNAYIDQVQNDTLSSYPLTITAKSDILSTLAGFMGKQKEAHDSVKEEGYVYSREVMRDMWDAMANGKTNNLRDFKKYVDSSEDIAKYAMKVRYGYDISPLVYFKDPNGKIMRSDMAELMLNMYEDLGISVESAAGSSMSSFGAWKEMLAGEDGELVSDVITSQYDVLAGRWPEAFNEAILVVSEDCEVSDFSLYALGLKPYEDMIKIIVSSMTGEEFTPEGNTRWTFDELIGTEYRLIISADRFEKQPDGTYVDLSTTDTGLQFLYENNERSTPVKIVGVVKPTPDSTGPLSAGTIGCTAALCDYAVSKAPEKDAVKEQLADPDTDVITGLPFKPLNPVELTAEEKEEHVRDYFSALDENGKYELYLKILSTPDDKYVNDTIDAYLAQYGREELKGMMLKTYAEQMGMSDTTSVAEYLDGMSDEEFKGFFRENAKEAVVQGYAAEAMKTLGTLSAEEITMMFESSEHDYSFIYENFMPDEYSRSTYEDNLRILGYVDEENPASISIYVSTFEDKDKIADAIEKYNNGVEEDDQIKYTDYFKILMSGISTVINAISYVLMAFVGISLVVSSIMIGIITYISVLERTKEIGILRAIGASKKDVSRVFNAETLTVGFAAGVIGIGVSLLLTIPINLILHYLTDIYTLSAQLPVAGAIILVLISMFLTFIAGLIPSGIAAKKDPVEALRTE